MTSLSAEQVVFLTRHKIDQSQVFDATGCKGWSKEMDLARDAEGNLKYLVAMGVRPCDKAGHTLRDRHNHCVMCGKGAQYLTYAKRHHEFGDVYIASSESSDLVKVGYSVNAKNRIREIRNEGYGGIKDWELAHTISVNNAGKLETRVHQLLSDYSEHRSYIKDGCEQQGNETFGCSVERAKETLSRALEEGSSNFTVSTNQKNKSATKVDKSSSTPALMAYASDIQPVKKKDMKPRIVLKTNVGIKKVTPEALRVSSPLIDLSTNSFSQDKPPSPISAVVNAASLTEDSSQNEQGCSQKSEQQVKPNNKVMILGVAFIIFSGVCMTALYEKNKYSQVRALPYQTPAPVLVKRSILSECETHYLKVNFPELERLEETYHTLQLKKEAKDEAIQFCTNR